MEDELDSFDTVNLRDLREGAKALQQFKPWSVDGHGLMGLWMVLAVIGAILVGLLIAGCVWRKRLFMLWSLTSSSNRGGAVSWNRLS